jgi:hypothetical protein
MVSDPLNCATAHVRQEEFTLVPKAKLIGAFATAGILVPAGAGCLRVRVVVEPHYIEARDVKERLVFGRIAGANAAAMPGR